MQRRWQITYTSPEAPGRRLWLSYYPTREAAREGLNRRAATAQARGTAAHRTSEDELTEERSTFRVERVR